MYAGNAGGQIRAKVPTLFSSAGFRRAWPRSLLHHSGTHRLLGEFERGSDVTLCEIQRHLAQLFYTGLGLGGHRRLLRGRDEIVIA